MGNEEVTTEGGCSTEAVGGSDLEEAAARGSDGRLDNSFFNKFIKYCFVRGLLLGSGICILFELKIRSLFVIYFLISVGIRSQAGPPRTPFRSVA